MLFKPSKKEIFSLAVKNAFQVFDKKYRQPLVDAIKKAETNLSGIQRKTDERVKKKVLAPYVESENQINNILQACGFARCFKFVVGGNKGSFVGSLVPGELLAVQADIDRSCHMKPLRVTAPNSSRVVAELKAEIDDLKLRLARLDRSVRPGYSFDEDTVRSRLIEMSAVGDKVEKLLGELSSVVTQLTVDDKALEAIVDEHVNEKLAESKE